MASIRRRVVNGRTYFYLGHSLRRGNHVEKRERYLGPAIPSDIERVKREFMDGIYRELWFVDLESIKIGYARKRKVLPPTARDKETEAFATTFTYNTNRIEGSRLTLRETAALLERGIAPSSRLLSDIKEAEAHRDAFYEMLAYKRDVSMQTVLYFHKRLFEGTKRDIAGRLREHQVGITGSRFLPPMPAEVYPLLVEFFKWYARSRGRLHPVELAGLVHLKLVTIHPFTDGNGRVSRLVMDLVLNRNGYPMLDIPYEKRGGYYRALERSQVKEDDDIFLHWFFKRYIAGNKRYIG
jgi:Fic family protein